MKAMLRKTIRFDREMWERLNLCASADGLSVSSAVRELVADYIHDNEMCGRIPPAADEQ